MEKIYLAWLHYIWFTHKKLHKIFESKQNYKEIFDKINNVFLKSQYFNDNQIKIILERYENLDLNSLIKKLKNRNVKIVTYFCKNYPYILKNISNPPFLFYLRWEIDSSPKIAVIWSRKISTYWEKILETIIPNLSKYFSIVSGGASGCDSKAHIETLKAEGKTISVIWTWIDKDYPVWNKKLFQKIVDSGWAIISMFPVGEVWKPYNFPVRNEIVAGLSEWVLVVEAREKSGSLITAKLGLDMWKDLFAVPWDIFRWGSIWTNNLIKNWEAKLVSNSNDILEEYNISIKKEIKIKKIIFSDKIEENIYNMLLLENLSIDDLSIKLNLNIKDISFKISIMEIRWVIYKNLTWRYEIK